MSMNTEQKRPIVSFGKTMSGDDVLVDLARQPHLLIGGRTGSGKSNFILHIISTLMHQFGPDDMQFILADPKRVELMCFKDSPYLVMPIVLQVNQMIIAIDWLVAEMERRFLILEDAHTMDADIYREKVDRKMPYIFFIADEMSDFMESGERGVGRQLEKKITTLLALGRAVGIHVILATSRISRVTFPPVLVANTFARLVFQTATRKDSRWILDGNSGAAELSGHGDALFMVFDQQDAIQLQTPLYRPAVEE